MKKVILYIAMSLDGFIADINGGVDWLGGEDKENNESSYEEFIKTIDTIIMGYTTYNQLVTELSPDKWVYEGMKTYIITHKDLNGTEDIIFTKENITQLILKLKSEGGKDIWVCGGANIINQLIESDMIDNYQITIIPQILGQGIPLFDKNNSKKDLKLVDHISYNGMVDLIYDRISMED